MMNLDTLLSNFPDARLVAVIDDNGVFAADGVRVHTLSGKWEDDRRFIQSVREAASRDQTTCAVLTKRNMNVTYYGLHALPLDLVRSACVVVEPFADGTYRVFKDRFGAPRMGALCV